MSMSPFIADTVYETIEGFTGERQNVLFTTAERYGEYHAKIGIVVTGTFVANAADGVGMGTDPVELTIISIRQTIGVKALLIILYAPYIAVVFQENVFHVNMPIIPHSVHGLSLVYSCIAGFSN